MNEDELRTAIESCIAKQQAAEAAQAALQQAQRDRDTAVNALRVQAELTATMLKGREVIFGDSIFRTGHNTSNDFGCRQVILTPLVKVPVVAPTPAPQFAPPIVAKTQPAPSLKGGSVPPAGKPKLG